MTLSSPILKKYRKQIPFDDAAMRDMPSWRTDLGWPTSAVQVAEDVRQGLAGYLELVSETDEPDLRRLLLTAGPHIYRQLLLMLDYARSLQNAEAAGIELMSEQPEFDYFKNGGKFPGQKLEKFVPSKIVVPQHPQVRKLINIIDWTPIWNVPATYIFPTASAFSANSRLMHEHVKTSGARLTFRDPGHYLIEARLNQRTEDSVNCADLGELADRIIDRFTKSGRLEGIYLKRFCNATRRDVKAILAAVLADLIQLRRVKLPAVAWTGSSTYQSRIVGHEIIRRGGDVLKFDHGGSTGLNGWPERDAFVELNGVTCLVMATDLAAQMTRRASPEKFVSTVHRCDIIGGRGYPHLRQISHSDRPSPGCTRRRIMYCPTFSRAHFSNPGETMGEPIHTDFTLRICEALRQLPANLVIKPHPQAVAPNGRHYTEDVAKVSYEKFEDVMDDVDVFIFDVMNSTTFWEATCTHKIIVLIHLDTIVIGTEIMPLLKRRCTVLEARYDDAGLPQVDLEQLEEAVLSSQTPDPTEFRRLLADCE